MAIISSQKKKKMTIIIMVKIGKEINLREIYGVVRKRVKKGRKKRETK